MKERQMRAHREKRKQAKTTINNVRSTRDEEKLVCARRNAKREQVESDKRDDIKRENIRLLLRMQAIGDGRVPVATAQPQQLLPPIRSYSQPEVRKGSNIGPRMQELRRIDTENRKMLERMHKQKPSVNVSKMEQEHKAQRKVMFMRCEQFQADAPLVRSRLPKVRYWDPADPLLQERRNHNEGTYDLDEGDFLGVGGSRPSSANVRLPPLGGGSASTGALIGRGAPRIDDDVELVDEADIADAVDVQAGGSAGSRAASPSHIAEIDDGFDPSSERFGFVIPHASRKLVDQLLEADAQQKEAQADAEAAAAKEAAEQSFRDASAVDTGSAPSGNQDFDTMGYDAVIRRCQERQDRLGPSTSALEARAAVAAANGRACRAC